jgi:hypothetical protein
MSFFPLYILIKLKRFNKPKEHGFNKKNVDEKKTMSTI